MAQTVGNILVGAATIFVDDWITAGVPVGSPTEVGFTKGPVTLTPAFTDYEVKAEQALMTVAKSPTDAKYTLKIPMIEATHENLAIMLRQPAANITGTPPDTSLAVDKPELAYKQVRVVGPGLGTTSVRTIYAWRAVVQEVAELAIGKDQEQLLDVTFDCIYDSSVSTNDKVLDIVDS